jgi:hypothetical protein
MDRLNSATTPPIADPTDDELYEAAVRAVGRVLRRRWGQDDTTTLRRAEWLVDRALEAGVHDMMLLIRGHPSDCYRLADAVRRTGSCRTCDAPAYAGQPTESDLRAAEMVIDALLQES